MSDDWGWRFPRSGPPRPVKDGIRARSKRGAFARSWWARRWLEALTALEIGGRLSRGRAYARRGQVMDIAMGEGPVRARVQGSREEPYQVEIRVAPLSRAAWRRVAAVLSKEAVFLAKLLAGEMPAEIESAFAKAGVSLFPTRRSELQTSCTCPDLANPCKHVAAVYYLLGEEFDRDPFLLFQLRGLTRDELLGMVEQVEDSPADTGGEPPPAIRRRTPPVPAPNSRFWRAGEQPPDTVPEPPGPDHVGALLARLGPFPFWRGRQPLPDALLPLYEAASASALALLAELTPPAPPREGPGGGV